LMPATSPTITTPPAPPDNGDAACGRRGETENENVTDSGCPENHVSWMSWKTTAPLVKTSPGAESRCHARSDLTVRLVRECRIPVRIWRLLSCPDPFYLLMVTLMWRYAVRELNSLDSGLCDP
jgi:hypothetical protein